MRAKSHDQRKGQWLINKIRSNFDYEKLRKETVGVELFVQEKIMVELRLWNMENDEFDKLMGDYND